MKLTFEQLQLVISTLMLLPAMVALVVFGLRGKFADTEDQWSPTRFPERDWWSEEEPP